MVHILPSPCFILSPQSVVRSPRVILTVYRLDRICSGIHSRLFCLFTLYILSPVEANLKIRRPVKNTDWKTLTGRLSLKTLYFKTVQSRRAIKLGCIRACKQILRARKIVRCN